MSYGTTPNKKTGVKHPTRKSATASYPSLGSVGQDAKENPTTIQQIMLKGSEDSGLSVDKAITRRRREEERGREKKSVKRREPACQRKLKDYWQARVHARLHVGIHGILRKRFA